LFSSTVFLALLPSPVIFDLSSVLCGLSFGHAAHTIAKGSPSVFLSGWNRMVFVDRSLYRKYRHKQSMLFGLPVKRRWLKRLSEISTVALVMLPARQLDSKPYVVGDSTDFIPVTVRLSVFSELTDLLVSYHEIPR
jgi:hypothetical protein